MKEASQGSIYMSLHAVAPLNYKVSSRLYKEKINNNNMGFSHECSPNIRQTFYPATVFSEL